MANLDRQRANSKVPKRKADSPSKEAILNKTSDANNDDDHDDGAITIVNHKDALRVFIEKTSLGIQFAIIVLFYLAQEYLGNKSQASGRSDANTTGIIDLSSFSFTSKEFFDTYSQLALEMGLTKYLIRHIAFAEFILTLEYLALIREEELTARYQFKTSFEDLKWMASIALQQIVGGQSLSSPEIFYPSTPRATLPAGKPQPDKALNPPALTNTDRTTGLVKELSQNIFSQKEMELNRGDGISKNIDDVVNPRSRDYGLFRPYFQHRVPPTQYSFRMPNEDETRKIYQEFIENQACIVCDGKIMLDYFDIWIGEPIEQKAPEVISDQRMTEVLGNTTEERSDTMIREIARHNYHPTERELLSFSYGIIPMSGTDAFIAFAKPSRLCPYCGTNPANSVSLMP